MINSYRCKRWRILNIIMADVHSTKTRSKNMSRIKHQSTRPELMVRKALHCAGYRFRLHRKDLPGKPDIVLPKYRAIILVNGCFWHKHECYLFKWPSTRQSWWKNKLERNSQRDAENQEKLVNDGWRVFVIWECALRGPYRWGLRSVIAEFKSWLEGQALIGEVEASKSAHQKGA